MPYVDRNDTGKVMGLYASSQKEAQEFLPEDDPEVLAYRAAKEQRKADLEMQEQQARAAMSDENIDAIQNMDELKVLLKRIARRLR